MTDLVMPAPQQDEPCSWEVLPPEPPEPRYSSRPRLYRAPAFLDGEAPSSWIHRTGVWHSLCPRSVLRLLNWEDMAFTLDFADGFGGYYVALAAFTTLADATLLHRRLHAGIWLLGDLRYNYRYPLAEYVDGTPIYRYCARCLAEDTVPHFRLRWRLAPVVLCERHQVVLSERCPICLKRLNLTFVRHHRLRPDLHQWALRYCPACGAPLTEDKASSPPEPLGLVLRGFERLFLDALARERCPVNGRRDRGWRDFGDTFFREVQPSLKWWQRYRWRKSRTERIDWQAVLGPVHFDMFVEWLNGRLDLTSQKQIKK